MEKYSIIIPVLNEEENLPKLFKHLKNFKENFEIILVDGGSNDNSIEIIKGQDVKYFKSEKGRGRQLNLGAENASGEILIFLHADTFLPSNTFTLLSNEFNSSDAQVATFSLKFDVDCKILKFYEKFSRVDSIFTCFGDQVIIVQKEFFNKIGKFPNYSIMEDVDFLRRARRSTKIKKLNASVITSSRRFLKKGKIKTQLLNGWYILQYLIGVDPDRIYTKYFSN